MNHKKVTIFLTWIFPTLVGARKHTQAEQNISLQVSYSINQKVYGTSYVAVYVELFKYIACSVSSKFFVTSRCPNFFLPVVSNAIYFI